MKDKHIQARVRQCLALAELSNCPRRKLAAMLIEPERMTVKADGYNGSARGGGNLCGGDTCLRDTLNIESGTRIEIGCHHAEMNTLCNALFDGVSTKGTWLIVTGEPCIMCAKLIHQCGIERVIVIDGGYAGDNGCSYLEGMGVGVLKVDGPTDPRLMPS